MKEYLGEGGKLQDLFDENKKNSALSKLSEIFKQHFEGEGSVIYKLLDSDNSNSPLFRLRRELLERLGTIEKSLKIKEAVLEEQEKGTAKGVVFEDLVAEKLNDIAKILDDNVISVGNMKGKLLNSKAGDIVSKLNEQFTNGNSLGVVVEVKDQQKALPAILKELDEAKENRNTNVGIAVFSRLQNSPRECGNFRIYPEGRIICVLDKESLDTTALEVAYKIARIEALNQIKGDEKKLDLGTFEILLDQIRVKLNNITNIKTSLTSVNSGIEKAKGDLDELRKEIFAVLEEMTDRLSRAEDNTSKTEVKKNRKNLSPILGQN